MEAGGQRLHHWVYISKDYEIHMSRRYLCLPACCRTIHNSQGKKSPDVSISGRMDKEYAVYINILEQYSALLLKKILSLAATRTNLKDLC
jgi:hypothetical protein